MHPKLLVLFICTLSLISYVSSDVYLPAFIDIQEAFQTTKAHVEFTISSFMLGLAIGQLIYGTLSDTFGRKKTLAVGLMLYTAASFLCAFSPNIYILWVGRVLQALGVCAPAALWQAIIVDSFREGSPRDRVFSIAIPVIALSPVFSPIIGGYLTAHIGWHAVFMLLGIIGLCLFTFTAFIFKETLPLDARKALNWGHWQTQSKTLLHSRPFQAYMGVVVMITSSFFVYITEIPFVLHKVGLSEEHIGFMFIPQTIAFMIGGFVTRWMPHQHKHRSLVGLALTAIVGSVILIIASTFGYHSAWQFMGPYSLIAFANGAMYPLAYALVYESHGDMAGMVAGLGGFLLAFVGFLTTGLMSVLSAYGAMAMSILILLTYVATLGALTRQGGVK